MISEADMNASWTQDQIEQLNRIQRGELEGGCTCCSLQGLQGHPHICPNRFITPHHDNGRDIGCLLATKDGWLCPDCAYTERQFHKPQPEPLQGATPVGNRHVRVGA